MSLKKNLILLLMVSGAILILLLYVALQVTLRPLQKDQKVIFVEKLKKRIHIALALEEKNIALLSANWADWESMVNYVEYPSTDFEADVFPDDIFNEDMMDIVLITSLEGRILFCKGYKDKRFLDMKAMNISGAVDKLSTLVRRKKSSVRAVID